MKHGKIKKIGFFTIAAFLFGLIANTGFPEEKLIPWTYGGYQKVSEFYLKYWSLSSDTLQEFKNIQEGNLKYDLSELWFSQNPPRLRIDNYIEEGSIKCTQFKGREWEKITHEGKTYVLNERIIQTNSKRIAYSLENISSGGGVELCEYKKYETEKNVPASLKDVLYLLTVIPYIPEPDFEEMTVASLEMDELLDPEKYKKTINELKKRYEKVGRQTAKWETGHGILRFPAQGFAFMDLEWGIALEGYLTGQRGGGGLQPVTLENPVCVYKAMSIETKISDPNVFKKWMN
jgi:hypothetical protein